jgi:uncharacterized RDD family membrane protein YckC
MEIGLRILALMIDLAVCFGSLPLVVGLTGWLIERAGGFALLLLPFWFVLILVWPLLCVAIPTGIWGKSLGKLVCRLTVTDLHGRSPGVWRALGREVLKFLARGSGIGTLLTLYQILYQGGTWYDQLCGTSVEFSPYVRLTQTQKNWRQHMKNR